MSGIDSLEAIYSMAPAARLFRLWFGDVAMHAMLAILRRAVITQMVLLGVNIIP